MKPWSPPMKVLGAGVSDTGWASDMAEPLAGAGFGEASFLLGAPYQYITPKIAATVVPPTTMLETAVGPV